MGVAIPGPFDYQRGIGMFVGVQKSDAPYGHDLRTSLMEGITATLARIGFVDDGEASLGGEWLTGAARGCCRSVARLSQNSWTVTASGVTSSTSKVSAVAAAVLDPGGGELVAVEFGEVVGGHR
jgi:hypothetical protein